MGIATSTGLASGIDTASLVEQLLAIEARPKQLAQARIAELQREQAAFLEINSVLGGLESAAGAFRLDNVFDSTVARSSNAEVLGATVTGRPPAGEFEFVVDRLVSTQRRLSRGFTDRDATGLGLSALTFERGGGAVRVDTSLSSLRGGDGIERGVIRITDKTGASAEIDLSRVGTVNEVLEKINSESAIRVSASTDGDGFVLEDVSGGSGDLVVESVFGSQAAESLGIAGTSSGTTLTGEALRTISRGTALGRLNDGVGVLVKDATTDLRITAKNGTVLNIDLGEQSRDVLAEDFFYDGVEYAAGTDLQDIPGSPSADDLEVLRNDFELDGTTYVEGTPLGVLEALDAYDDLEADERPLTVTAEVEREVTRSRATTVGDVLDVINAAAADAGVGIEAALSADGRGLTVTDSTGGAGNLVIGNGPSGDTASSLGLVADTSGSVVASRDLLADINSVLTSSLDGGRGLEVSDFELTDSSGNAADLSGIDVSGSLNELIERINGALLAEGNTLRARVNDAGNGVAFEETVDGGGLISIEGGLAEQLRVDVEDFDGALVEGGSAQLKWIGLNTQLAGLNNGRGVGRGEVRITDSLGVSRVISINTASDDNTSVETVDDLIRRINSTPEIGVEASLNATGDGILLTDTAGGGGNLVVEDESGSVAANLNIAGTFEDEGFGVFADGTYERRLEFSETDTLDDVVQRINDEGVGVVASLVNDGSANAPWRLSLTARDPGKDGRVLIGTGGVDLGLRVTDEGNDARVFFGASEASEALLIDSSSNSLTNVIEGVTLDLTRASDEPVTVTVAQDDAAIEESARGFVDAFNAVIDVFNKYDTYDEATETAGVLLGDNPVSNVRRRLYDVVQGPARNVDSPFRFLFEVGIQVGDGAKLEFDVDRFRDALERDRGGVEELIAGFSQDPLEPQEVAPGAFVTPTEPTFSSLGVAELMRRAVEDLTDSIDGTLKNKDDTLQRQIDLQEDRIDNFDVQLANKRAQLEAEFLAMERAIADLQSQQQALNQLAG